MTVGRGRRLPAFGSLAVALVAAGAFLAGSPPQRATPASAGATPSLPDLAQVWPNARPSDAPGLLADGSAYTPLLYFDPQTSIGSAPTPDKTAVRIMLRTGASQVRELHRAATGGNPQFAGFVASGDDVVWAESTADASGHAETRLWKANWRTGGPAASITADTGDAIFFNSQYDLVIADGRVHWAAAARSAEVVTEVRSVPLGGGKVDVRKVPGAYALSAWPWLVSAGSGQAGPVELYDMVADRKVRVPAASTELLACTPAWCRVLVLSGTGGPARVDLMRPDGNGRRRIAGSQTSAATADVALLDRFEVLSQPGPDGSPTSSQQLMVHDAAKNRTVIVSRGVGTISARGGVLVWSTGDNEALGWHALDLRSLS
ncbi:hypothetical protein HC028_03805 [Planosporangium flavigriseum]|uniref:WD40 repeat domain-containing protein n=1 Tax=Planosporangium flavigriseum TaxID=373681 RepID=A0A8J3LQX3_9ACTN|nr:hypothetical protein [Planosporangium flavigriseum]NJC63637.1 hypothetical protein [Planosporangium flavigriseum]GIG72339.1 hypothetical protein Pfl04_07430 [Planosporangium flavigriseum]